MKTRILFIAMMLLGAVEILNAAEELKSGDVNPIIINCTNFDMVYIEGGTFNQLSPATQDVKVSNFYIGKYEVTQELWFEIMGSNPSHFTGNVFPVENISWEDITGAGGFLEKLNAKDIAPAGYKFVLPSNAEWEYAARGGKDNIGTDSDYVYSGGNEIGGIAWYVDNSENKTHIMGTKDANALGVYDMTGNVSEWIGDVNGSTYYSRGGGWDFNVVTCKTDNLTSITNPTSKNSGLGFRLALIPILPVDITVGGVTFKMIYVEKGAFLMGTDDTKIKYAQPVHQVTLSGYFISETEVTQALWKAVMGEDNNPSKYKGDELPTETIRLADAQAFITALNIATGKTFRLPTEAEWEFAARGGNKSNGYMYSGSNTAGDVAWWYQGPEGQGTHVVKSKAANELGIYDMSGNVSEFCSDYAGDYTIEPKINPVGPTLEDSMYPDPAKARCVNRGGSWGYQEVVCRVDYRTFLSLMSVSSAYGLRLVLVQ